MGLDMFAYKVPRKNRIDALHFCKGKEGEIEEIKQLCQRVERMQNMFVFELHKPEVIVRCL